MSPQHESAPVTPAPPEARLHRHARPALSFELFPARSEAPVERLHRTIDELLTVEPDFVSVTSKPGRSNFAEVCALVQYLADHTSVRPLVHLTCTAMGAEELRRTVHEILDMGVRGILALRGDYPAGHSPETDELPFARYLVELIREVESERITSLAAGRVSIGVAAYAVRHPESATFQHDVEVLLAKERSGANFAITQVFWDAAEYSHLVARARRAGVTIPILPGFLPTGDPLRLLRLQELTGVPVPRPFMHALLSARSDDERFELGVERASALMNDCLDQGAPGVHLYTFNQHRDALAALERVNLERYSHRDAHARVA